MFVFLRIWREDKTGSCYLFCCIVTTLELELILWLFCFNFFSVQWNYSIYDNNHSKMDHLMMLKGNILLKHHVQNINENKLGRTVKANRSCDVKYQWFCWGFLILKENAFDELDLFLTLSCEWVLSKVYIMNIIIYSRQAFIFIQ